MIIKNMWDFIWNFFTKNLVWKLLSLALAILIWFIVVNNTNPLTTKRFRVQLSIINENVLLENDYLVKNKLDLDSTYIDIYIRASKTLIDEISSDQSGLKAYIDLEPIDFSYSALLGESLPITVKYTLPNTSCEVIRYTPDKVNIEFDKYITKSFPITVETTGEVPEGYLSFGVDIEPEYVLISGPMSVINTITSVKAPIEVSDATSTINLTRNLIVYDYLNKDITNKLELSVNTTEVTLPISKYGRVYINSPRISGEPAEGYVVTSVEYYPKYIEVVGDEEVLNTITAMTLDTINIAGIDQTAEYAIDTRAELLSNNLNVKNFSQYQVTVTVKVEEIITKEFEIPTSQIVVGVTDLSYSFEEKKIYITVRGPSGAIDEMTGDDIALYVDAANDDVGSYTKTVSITLPISAEMTKDPPPVTLVLSDDS